MRSRITLSISAALMTVICISVIKSAIAGAEKPQKIHFIRQSGVLPGDWYWKQAELWEKVVKKDSRDTTAWFNFFMATHYGFKVQPRSNQSYRETMEGILNQMGEAIPNTFEYHFCRVRLTNDEKSLELAHRLAPDKPEPYYGFIRNAELSGDTAAFIEHGKTLYHLGDIAPGLLNYNYNVLASLPPKAILFTNGDNDTYPIWVLQGSKSIRRDIAVLNVHLIKNGTDYLIDRLQKQGIRLAKSDLPVAQDPDFMEKLIKRIHEASPHAPIYLALTLDKSIYQSFKSSLYLTGLAMAYNTSRIDNHSLLVDRFLPSARLDYLRYDWYSETHPSQPLILNKLQQNYIAPFLMAGEYYQKLGRNAQAAYWQEFAMVLAEKSGIKGDLKHYLEKQ